MRINVSKLCYADLLSAFAASPFEVRGISAQGDEAIVECAPLS
ncbi:MAG: hypothetical protein WC607_02115 [Candidatus Micrarchaeia archaeon]